MRVSTDDGLLGFIVTPVTDSGLYRFQIIIGGEIVGDTEPCFLESAMRSLGTLYQADDVKMGEIADPASVLARIESDDLLHDAALLQVAESLDGWKVRGYVYEGNAMLLAQAYITGSSATKGSILVSVVSLAEYLSVFDVAHSYWAQTRNGKKRLP
jgi:hypothetical protein